MRKLPLNSLQDTNGRLWPVAENYAIHGGRLVEVGRIVRLYPLAGVHGLLPGELAKLREDDEQAEAAILAFAKRYGLLGQAWMFTREKLLLRLEELERSQGGAEVSVGRWGGHAAFREQRAFHEQRATGEGLNWIRAHARTIELVAEGIAVLKGRSEAQAREFWLQRLSKPLSIAIRSRIQRVVPSRSYEAKSRVSTDGRQIKQWAARVSYLRAVAENVCEFISPNIRGERRRVLVTDQDTIRSTFTCNALIESAYLALLKTAEAETGAIGHCRECKTPFIVTHGRQVFCPPGPTRKESPCALRWHQREHHKRAKQLQRRARKPRRKR